MLLTYTSVLDVVPLAEVSQIDNDNTVNHYRMTHFHVVYATDQSKVMGRCNSCRDWRECAGANR